MAVFLDMLQACLTLQRIQC